MPIYIFLKKWKKAFNYLFEVYKNIGKRLEENLSKYLKWVRVQIWHDTTMAIEATGFGQKDSAEMLQLVENLLHNNDKFHWFSFLLENRNYPVPLQLKSTAEAFTGVTLALVLDQWWDGTEILSEISTGGRKKSNQFPCFRLQMKFSSTQSLVI